MSAPPDARPPAAAPPVDESALPLEEEREPVQVSLVVPVFDEAQNLPILHGEIVAALEPTGWCWEVLYVNDRSRDASLEIMLELWRADPRVRVVAFRRRSGQTAAMAAGFEHARGRVVVTLDGDLQNDPADVPHLVRCLGEGYDVVAGWRKERYDGLVLRRLPSVIANRLIALVTGVAIHDTGCTLKAFRHELVQALPIYAEQHRFLPAMSVGSGARITEVVVNHRPRRFGRSKYGLGRATRVLLDLLTIKMISSFSHQPLQYFALLALPFGAGTVVLLLTGLLGSGDGGHGGGAAASAGREELALLAFLLLVMAGVYLLLLGLLAELVVKVSGLHDATRGRRILTTGIDG